MEVLYDLIIILGVSALVLYVNARLNLPSIVGFLVAGVLVGPYGVELISTIEEVNVMAEIGILLLLFSIGIEFSLEKLIEARKYVLVGGALQVFGTILIFMLAAYGFGLEIKAALFVGMLLAMSSTAIVLQIFQERGWMSTPFGKSSVSILIFQDIIIIPMMLVTPYLTDLPQEDSQSIGAVALGVVLIAVVVLAARKVIPPLLRSIVHTRNQELFLLTIIIVCFATAFITKQLGLKLALGAFLAGLIISESEYSFEALKNITPFKKIFTALFFISVGMLLDLSFVGENVWFLLGVTLLVMLVKFLLIVPIVFFLKIGIRSAIISGLALCQVGEFAFILSKTGLDFEILSTFTYQSFLSISILSMIISTLLVSYAPQLAEKMVSWPVWKSWMEKLQVINYLPPACQLVEHTVIVGFGPGGRRIATHLAAKGIALSVIERNERNIQEDDSQLGDIIVGDAKQNEILQRAAVELAERVIITVPEVGAAEDIVVKVRKLSHTAKIVVRTKYVQETEHLLKLGANQVIPEELSVADAIMANMA